MLPMKVFVYVPETSGFLFYSSFETLLEPHRWRFTVQSLVDELLRVASVDISEFHDDICACSTTASGFSIPHNFRGWIHLSIWIPALDVYDADSEEEDDQAEINMALEQSFHESFHGRGGFGAVPATREAIDMLNTFIVEEEDGDGEDGAVSDVSCAVCLEDILPGDRACALPCSHEYHDGCIRRWLEASRLCPLCRFALE